MLAICFIGALAILFALVGLGDAIGLFGLTRMGHNFRVDSRWFKASAIEHLVTSVLTLGLVVALFILALTNS